MFDRKRPPHFRFTHHAPNLPSKLSIGFEVGYLPHVVEEDVHGIDDPWFRPVLLNTFLEHPGAHPALRHDRATTWVRIGKLFALLGPERQGRVVLNLRQVYPKHSSKHCIQVSPLVGVPGSNPVADSFGFRRHERLHLFDGLLGVPVRLHWCPSLLLPPHQGYVHRLSLGEHDLTAHSAAADLGQGDFVLRSLLKDVGVQCYTHLCFLCVGVAFSNLRCLPGKDVLGNGYRDHLAALLHLVRDQHPGLLHRFDNVVVQLPVAFPALAVETVLQVAPVFLQRLELGGPFDDCPA